jgi:hypothetical protein
MKKNFLRKALSITLAAAFVATSIPGTALIANAAVTTNALTPKYQYDFENNLTEKSGEITAVAKAKAMAKYSGEVTYDTGREGTGNSINLAGSYGLDLNVPNMGTAYTISLWAKPAAGLSDNTQIMFLGTNTPAEDWIGLAGNTNKALKLWTREVIDKTQNGWKIAVDNAVYTLNEWQQYILSVDNGTASLYRNGVLLGSGSVSATSFSREASDLYLGVNFWPDGLFNGSIDEVKVYDTAVSAAEASALYNGGIGITGATSALVGDEIATEVAVTDGTEGATVAFSSSDTTLAEVDAEGKVTCKAAGKVEITASLMNGETVIASDSITIDIDETGDQLAAAYPNKIADFTFDDEETGFAGAGAKATAGNGAIADMLATDDDRKVLQLEKAAEEFLSVTKEDGSSLLTGLTDVKISFDLKGSGWALYAAPNTDSQVWKNEYYLGALVSDTGITIERYMAGRSPVVTGSKSADAWVHVDIVAKEDGTILYLDGVKAGKADSAFTLAEMLGNASVLQLGKANWNTGEYSDCSLDNFSISVRTDLTALKAAVADAKTKVEADYSTASWATFAEKLGAAEAAIAKAGTTQVEAEAAAEELATAQAALTTDKTALKAAIADAVSEDDAAKYTEETWNTYKAALDAAKAVDDAEDAKQSAIDAAAKALTDAQAALEEVKEALTEDIRKNATPSSSADTYVQYGQDASKFADDDANSFLNGWWQMNKADDWASEVQWMMYDFGDKTAEISACSINWYDNTITGDGGVVAPTAIKIEYMNEKDEWVEVTPSGEWTYASKNATDEADVYGFEPVQTSKIRVTVTEPGTFNDDTKKPIAVFNWSLTGKMVEPEEPTEIDKTVLQAAVDNAVPAEDESKYTADSWAAYKAALEAAQAVLANENATQNDVDDALAALEEAKEALTEDIRIYATASASHDNPNWGQPASNLADNKLALGNMWNGYGQADLSEGQWIMYDFGDKTAEISACAINWFDDGGGVLTPQAIKIEYTDADGEWAEVTPTGEAWTYASKAVTDAADVYGFEPVQTSKIRVSITLGTKDDSPLAAAAFEWYLTGKMVETEEPEPIESTVLADFNFDAAPAEGEGFDGGNATATGTYELVDHGTGKALKLNGTDQFLTVTDKDGNSLLTGVKELTVSFQMNPGQSKTNWGFFAAPNVNQQTYRSEKYLGIFDDNGTVKAERYNSNSMDRPVSPTYAAGKNKWSYITVVYTETETILYVNGVERGREDSIVSIPELLGDNSILYIGKSTWESGEYMTGLIDNYKIVKGAVPADVIAAEAAKYVEKDALQAAIDATESVGKEDEYTPSTWKAYADALAAAKTVLADDAATQAEVDAAATALTSAQKALKKVADKTALDAAIKAAIPADKKDNYTEDSWAAYEKALETAKTVSADAEATQTKVDSATKALTDAQKALKPAVASITVTAPTKTEYVAGEDLDLTGMKVVVTYVDGTEEEITEGYEVSGYDADKVGEQTITVTYGKEATFTVTVIAAELPFVDVSEDDWFYDAVYYNYFAGTMTGLNKDHFGPAQSLARAQFAVILYRMNDTPEVDYEAIFPDVEDDVWYTDAILWAADTGVVTGYTDTGKFGPADLINREQMAVMMYRYASYKGYESDESADISGYADAGKVSAFAKDAMEWAVGNGIISGKNEGTILDPQGNATRAECATIIMRFIEKFEK